MQSLNGVNLNGPEPRSGVSGSLFYICPSVAKPFGGVRRILRHIEILKSAGVFASLQVCPPSGSQIWTELANAQSGMAPSLEDICVIPETHTEALTHPGRKVIFAQSFGFLSAYPAGEDWSERQVVTVIAVSNGVKVAAERHFGIRAAVIAPSVDTTLFKPTTKEQSIAFMPRRNRSGIDEILSLAGASCFRSVPIDSVPHAEVADQLSRASIYLAASYSEGFGLPSLEAMASGCLVCGFAGGGGLDFMKDGVNCMLAEDGNNEQAAENLKLAIRLVSEDKHHAMVENAVLTAREFSPEREDREVLGFWRGVLNGGQNVIPGSPPADAYEREK